nr:ubiquitin carboxyl-terminal hydrolase isozyme L3-like [Parasteatoda tepidariorum]
MMSDSEWMELESNPDVMNNLLISLGVPAKWKIFDILSLDDEYLDTISQPVLGVIFIFPFTAIYKKYCSNLMRQLEKSLQNVDPKVFFMLQTIRNACGTIAVIHAIANNMEHMNLNPASIAFKFIKKCIALDPTEKARVFEKDAGIKEAHQSANFYFTPTSQGGSSSAEKEDSPQAPVKTSDNHYLTLVNVNSKLYELDGYKDMPVYHGDSTKETFLKDAARICREYIERQPDSYNFAVLAFGESETLDEHRSQQ